MAHTAPQTATQELETPVVPEGSYHQVQLGETLWRIAHSFDLDVAALAKVNRLTHVSQLQTGQRIFVPLADESARFAWPLLGTLAPTQTSKGVAIVAPNGSHVRAARGGQVAVAADHLSGWGKTVIVDHLDGYLSVYAWLDNVIVGPGATVRRGMPLGSLGEHALHFEIRHGARPQDTLVLLPRMSDES